MAKRDPEKMPWWGWLIFGLIVFYLMLKADLKF